MRQLRGRSLRIVKAVCILLFIILLIYYIAAALKKKVTPLYANGVVEASVGDIHYDFSTGMLTFGDSHGTYLQGIISETLRSTSALACRPNKNGPTQLCLHWLRYAKLEVRKIQDEDECHEIVWQPTSRDFNPHDCFSLRGAEWYGGGEMYTHNWPIQQVNIPLQPYLPNDLLFKSKQMKNGVNIFGNVVERFWINSKGVGIIVDSSVPLFVSINETGSNVLCFSSNSDHPRYPGSESETRVLKYSICKQKNVRKIYQLVQRKHFEIPERKPDLSLMQNPIFTSSPRFKDNFTQAILLKYVKDLKDKIEKTFKFEKLYFEFDGNFSTSFGNFDINPGLFRNAHQVIMQMKEYGYTVSVSMTPIINKDSRYFDSESNLWIQDKHGDHISLVKWYYGLGSLVDVTNPESVKWFKTKLKYMLKEYGIESFKFYACEGNFLPPNHKSYSSVRNPGFYVTMFISMISDLNDQNFMMQSTCGYKTQKYPVYIQLGSKESKWGSDNGLKSIIPAVLTLGILGYPFVIADVIGGSGFVYNISEPTVLPDKELYIRWLQMSSFFPVMKFSYIPWDYDHIVVDIAENLLHNRQKNVMPLLLKAAREAETNGAPIIRPLWWDDPADKVALTIGTQFFVGGTLMVAPVLGEGVREMDIYLPVGDWKDDLTNNILRGRQWLKGYEVKLNQIPTFTRHQALS